MSSNSKAAKSERRALRKDLEKQIEVGAKNRKENLDGRMAYLKAEIDMVSEKYLTVNGFMQAMSTIAEVVFRDPELLHAGGTREMARKIAVEMSELAKGLSVKLETEDVETIDATFLDGLLIADFCDENTHPTTEEIVSQLLIIQLLQNIGPSIDDLVQFREDTTRALGKLDEALVDVSEPNLASV